MRIKRLQVAGYRSIRDLTLPLGQVNVLVGPNGCGKTNLYRGMDLIARAASGTLARSLVEEGGMPSVLWAGPRTNKSPVRMTLTLWLDEFQYELSCGLPPPVPIRGGTAFLLDPEIKEESIRLISGSRKTELLHRENATIWARDAEGVRQSYPLELTPSESVLSELREPSRFPILSALREEFLSWRFYHQFRTDIDSPIRSPKAGFRSPVLDADGKNLASAIRTIFEIGDRPALEQAIEDAFPGAQLDVATESPGGFRILWQAPEFQRPFEARELSDGTLQYLCLVTALLSPRPPTLLALNEPESSLHQDLMEPLARLIERASRHSQLWITTHSERLANHLESLTGSEAVRLQKIDGETRLVR